ncbi:hypothetical protein CP966_21860 [Streptomyces galilaeus]|uniref:Uncharacterized protein n=2 Tax=Streptomyces bobili TaxID=67280 RepID=A0ABZ1QYD3_9ACTN|nr:hypothetical protein [Streptomyces galilaeus]QEU67584.1 hypothetical protein CP966_21860 [Streptomyces galilaeus]GGW86121.1 hypothetical protein GCM10010350_83200 [Streptomyces galilaeus]
MAQSAGVPGIAGGGEASPAGMRLNQIPLDPGGSSPGGQLPGGQKDLASSPAQKQAAAKAIEDHIEPDTKKAGDWAETETNAAVKAFAPKDGDGWVTSGALKKAHDTWDGQVQNLMSRLASEKAALRSTNTVLQNTDLGVGTDVRRISPIEGY